MSYTEGVELKEKGAFEGREAPVEDAVQLHY